MLVLVPSTLAPSTRSPSTTELPPSDQGKLCCMAATLWHISDIIFARKWPLYLSQCQFLELCLHKCCVDHGLPLKCINEETRSLKTDTLNDTHKAVEMVFSDKCNVFAKILQDCKASCMPPGKFCKSVYNLELERGTKNLFFN